MSGGEVEYRAVEGFPGYRVGSDGSVWSCRQHSRERPGEWEVGTTWRELRLTQGRTGYLRAALYRDGKQVRRSVHRLVLEAFVGPCPSGMQACHGNDVKTDARLENLRWDTPVANWRDRWANGRVGNLRGEDHPAARLTIADVLVIRRRRALGEKLQSIATDFGIDQGHVSAIARRKVWTHV